MANGTSEGKRHGAFDDKSGARASVWQTLREEGVARFPFPVEGRIPNFRGAEEAARRLMETELLASAKRIKCNPDSPQIPVRRIALERGITVYVPTPRLTGGFHELDPNTISPDDYRHAATLSKMESFSRPIALDELQPLDVIVCGSVAVTRDGRRCGKGHGYSDLEFAILRELGHDPPPVVTTVHELQVVRSIPIEETDVPLACVVTPEEVIFTESSATPPTGIDWARVTDEMLDEMPILRELSERR